MSGLSRAIEEHEPQQKIDPDLEEEPEEDPNTVYVVAANYDGPHPHIEGVFSEKGEAKELMEKCRRVATPPHPIAWQMFEVEIDGEVSVL